MSSKDIAIKVDNISKVYRIGAKEELHDSFGGALVDLIKSPLKNYRKYRSLYKFDDIKPGRNDNPTSNPSDIIWALNDISFQQKKGEVLGIIGRNGAGKSTLLKILSRITDPTSGRVEIRGKISSLLEVGTGFHKELTGRDNVYLNGTILGMKKKEVDRKFDEIVDFSGVEKFIDTPVKRYSSGMKVRLAFSVAAHMEPDILIIDEVLAVGDAVFQQKCLGKMSEVSRQGRTVLFVSHNMAAIEHLCSRVILLEYGKVQIDADPNKAITQYMSNLSTKSAASELGPLRRKSGLLPVIQKIEFFDEHGQSATAVPIGTSLTVHIHYQHSEPLNDPYFGLTFETPVGVKVIWVQTRLQKGHLPDLPAAGVIACHIPRLTLLPGTYFVSPGCGSQTNQLDLVPRGWQLQVVEADLFGTGRLPPPSLAFIVVDAEWDVIR
ncbi:MAG: ABC transporter ATP-binding protein [Thermodesulfobacteriota bacterium]|nr:ABC transporter ATP-binding protein [Thermodesulfobacteriota bacterium]